jgi:hypothetical protein
MVCEDYKVYDAAIQMTNDLQPHDNKPFTVSCKLL